MFVVYAISSTIDNYIYVGMTSDLEERLRRHYAGYERSTKPHRPFILIYIEECQDRPAARAREKYWKSATGKRKLKFLSDKIDEALDKILYFRVFRPV